MNTATAQPSEPPTVLTHVFQDRGLGVAPFHFVDLIAHPNPKHGGYEVALRDFYAAMRHYGIETTCHCHYCYTAIVRHCIIRDTHGKHFVVGVDCVAKTEDAQLITAAEAARRELERKQAWARAEAKQNARMAAAEDKRETERENNDGLLLDEWQELALNAAWEKFAAIAGRVNGWAVEVLRNAPASDFLSSILSEIRGKDNGRPRLIVDLPGRALSILAEIYGKTVSGKTLRAKETQAAVVAFWDNLDEVAEASTAAEVALREDIKAAQNAYWTARKGNGVFIMPESLRAAGKEGA